jgi:hypothetical protein
MTRAEADARAASLNEEAAGDTRWMVREAATGEWSVVRMTAPGLAAIRPSGTHSESRPEPSEPPDVRPAIFRNVPPYGAG